MIQNVILQLQKFWHQQFVQWVDYWKVKNVFWNFKSLYLDFVFFEQFAWYVLVCLVREGGLKTLEDVFKENYDSDVVMNANVTALGRNMILESEILAQPVQVMKVISLEILLFFDHVSNFRFPSPFKRRNPNFLSGST